MQPKYLSRTEVRQRIGTSDASLSRWIKAGLFPAPKRFGANTDRWDIADLDAYEADPERWKARHRVLHES